jgi:outer membrane phospholipase A
LIFFFQINSFVLIVFWLEDPGGVILWSVFFLLLLFLKCLQCQPNYKIARQKKKNKKNVHIWRKLNSNKKRLQQQKKNKKTKDSPCKRLSLAIACNHQLQHWAVSLYSSHIVRVLLLCRVVLEELKKWKLHISIPVCHVEILSFLSGWHTLTYIQVSLFSYIFF